MKTYDLNDPHSRLDAYIDGVLLYQGRLVKGDYAIFVIASKEQRYLDELAIKDARDDLIGRVVFNNDFGYRLCIGKGEKNTLQLQLSKADKHFAYVCSWRYLSDEEKGLKQ